MSSGGQRARQEKQLSARTLQAFGILLIAGSAIFWGFTGRESTLLVGAGVTLATLGWLQRAITTAQEKLPTYEAPELSNVLPEDVSVKPKPHRKGSS